MKLCRLNKTESINLVAYLCPEFTTRIIDRWLELEREVSGQSCYDQLQALSMNIRAARQDRQRPDEQAQGGQEAVTGN